MSVFRNDIYKSSALLSDRNNKCWTRGFAKPLHSAAMLDYEEINLSFHHSVRIPWRTVFATRISVLISIRPCRVMWPQIFKRTRPPTTLWCISNFSGLYFSFYVFALFILGKHGEILLYIIYETIKSEAAGN